MSLEEGREAIIEHAKVSACDSLLALLLVTIPDDGLWWPND